VSIDYKKFYELSYDLMCIVGPTHFVEVNDKFPRHLGYTREEMLAKPWVEFVHPDDRAASSAAYGSAPDGVTTYTNRYVAKDGSVIWFEWRGGRGADGQMYATCRDVTERKFIEDQLGKYLIDLRRSNDELEQFAYAASHDLQEPLRTISNYAQFIQEDHLSDLPPDVRENLDCIVEAAKQGRALVNDLLELSRVGREVHFGSVNLNEVVDHAVIAIEFQVRDSGATITRSDLPFIWGDYTSLLLLFRNLLSNGVKFCKPGEAPTVSVGAEEDAGGWHIWVRDNGIGIDPQYVQQIFAIFKRLDRSRPGTGIGLSICRKVVDRHGGRIWIESAPGQGATFHIHLPRHDPHARRFDPQNHPLGGGSSTGRTSGASSLQQAPGAAPPDIGPGRSGSLAVLASGGILRDRPTPRSGTPRSQPPEGLRLRSAGGGEG
jgi:PAS domain S-box-containing protein